MRSYVLALAIAAILIQPAMAARSYSSMLMNAAISHDLAKIRKERAKYREAESPNQPRSEIDSDTHAASTDLPTSR